MPASITDVVVGHQPGQFVDHHADLMTGIVGGLQTMGLKRTLGGGAGIAARAPGFNAAMAASHASWAALGIAPLLCRWLDTADHMGVGAVRPVAVDTLADVHERRVAGLRDAVSAARWDIRRYACARR